MSTGYIDLRLGNDAPCVLALGGWLKNTVCMVRGEQAWVSSIARDLDSAAACIALEETVAQMCVAPGCMVRIVAHDLHPDFFSTRLALSIAEQQGVPALAVQHHHAHVAAVCAEYGLTAPVLGLAMDGVGLGTDGQAWGGELLRLDGARFQRLGHLEPLRLPGGDRAARESWRMGAAALDIMGRNAEIATRFAAHPAAETVAKMLRCDFNCPTTSSLGRLFDAAAGLLGICPQQSFEGEAAQALQTLAERYGEVGPLAGGYRCTDVLDFRPLLAALADGIDASRGAALFHATLAAGLTDWVCRAAEAYAIRQLVCGGGCFLNGHLRQRLSALLAGRGIEVFFPRRVSPGDSSLSLGQAWVAVRDWQTR